MSGTAPDPASPASAPHEADAPRLSILSGLPTGQIVLRQGTLLIGRLAESDIQLDHPEISRYHCKLHWNGHDAQIEDLGSRRGTRLNGSVLPKGALAPLQSGDRIDVGPVALQFGSDGAVAAAAPVPAPHAESATVGASIARVVMGGHEVSMIPLRDKLVFGRASECEVSMNDAGVSRQHASIERSSTGFLVTDLRSRGGSFVNGHRFERHELVIGDQLQMGPFFFRFDGRQLVRTRGGAGVGIEGREVTKRVGALTILDHVSLRIERGQFVCILGPSGSGKSTLLDAITGLRPATAGTVLYDGMDLVREYEHLRSMLGYVPQDDIVHPELTVRSALLYSAQLRLPAGTPQGEIEKLVDQTIIQLGLQERANISIGRLSGGQRKRVSVGVELLGRPSVLFLDEPTSGLDPAAEFKMMELLRHLADGGCTVVCTTHLMENVYLADKLFVIAEGKLVFSGGPQDAREHFGVQKLTALYDRLSERPATEWQRDFERVKAERGALEETGSAAIPTNATTSTGLSIPAVTPAKSSPALPILLRRQWSILTSDIKNFLILFGQPVVIGGLVAMVTNESSLCLFFAYLSALWFGCSNSAQEIVKEIAIYRRERMVGLGRNSYLLSKFLLVGALTAVQSLILLLVLEGVHWLVHTQQPNNNDGREFIMGIASWQAGALILISLAAVGIGLAISALSKTTMQAVMIVPLALIPQILFSGLVVKAPEMKPLAYFVTQFSPSYAAQTIMDVSCFHGEYPTGLRAANNRPGFDHVSFLNQRATGKRLMAGDQFFAGARGWLAAFKLLAWIAAGYVVSFFGLKARERG